MKSRSEIWLRALEELGAQCSVDTTRDAETLARRVAREGDTFFKVALPAFGKDFEMSLSEGSIPTTAFAGFARRVRLIHIVDGNDTKVRTIKQSGGIPKFLGGFLELLFSDELVTTEEDILAAQADLGVTNFVFPTFLRLNSLGDETVGEAQMADAVYAIRQLCHMFGKEKELCSDARIEQAVTSYVETDEELELPFPTEE